MQALYGVLKELTYSRKIIVSIRMQPGTAGCEVQEYKGYHSCFRIQLAHIK